MSLVPVRKKYAFHNDYTVERTISDGLKVDVEKGADVTSETVIASGEILEEKAKIDIAEKLKVEAVNLSEYIESINGEMVSRGDIIAKKKVSFSGYRIVSAPCKGIISLDELDKGFVKIMGEARNIAIESGISGKVITAINNKKVSISTKALGVTVFEVWGKKVIGKLSFLTEKQELSLKQSGSVVVCDYEITADFVRDLQQNGVVGVISGGIDNEVLMELESFQLHNMTVVSLGGYGMIPIDRGLLSLFDDNDGNFIVIDPSKNELIIPSISDTKMRKSKDTDVVWLEAGMNVLVYNHANWGMTGIVAKVLGDRAIVKLDADEGKTISVAILNLVAYII